MDFRFAFLLAVQILCILSQGEAQFEGPPSGYGEFPYGNDGAPYGPPEGGYGQIPKVNCSELICGEGSCSSSFNRSKDGSSYSYSYNYSGSLCECDPKWEAFYNSSVGPFQYRPCVFPKCAFDSSLMEKCNFSPPGKPIPDPSNQTALVDPCAWTDCGMGTCVKLSEYRFECRCQEGFKNLFNDLAFPCMNQCMITDECEEKTGASFVARATARGGEGGGSKSGGKGGGENGGAANVPGKLLLGLFLAMAAVVA